MQTDKPTSWLGKIAGWLCWPFIMLFGRFSWTAPLWLQRSTQFIRRRPGRFFSYLAAVVVVTGLAGGGYYYYQQLPKPLKLIAELQTPGIGVYIDDVEQPTPLALQFSYDMSEQQLTDSDLYPVLSAARLDLIGEVITQGVTISPEINGQWSWQDENRLVFTPEQAWPAAQRYTVTLTPDIFAEGQLLKEDKYRFNTVPFTAYLDQLRFYQDPREKDIRRVVSTLSFSHPVALKTVYSQLSLTMRPSGADLRTKGNKIKYELTTDKSGRVVYVQSEPIQLPEKEQYLQLTLDSAVQAERGNGLTQHELGQQLLIPDKGSFLRVASLQADIVRNPDDEPEQIVHLELTDRINRQELQNKLMLYLLPKHPQRNSYSWSASEVSSQVLSQATLLPLTILPTELEHDTQFSLRLDAPVGQTIFVHIPAGLVSVSDFTLSREYRGTLVAPDYPKEAKIVGEGAILSLSGDQKLQLMTRGITGIKASLHKLLPEHLNHFISQSGGDITNPYFYNYSFNENNISALFEQEFVLPQTPAKQANYLTLPLHDYLQRSGMGVFFIKLTEFNPEYPDRGGRELDKRVVLVTDLGLMVKHNADSSQHVFVMSVADGQPVSGAKVELLGRNGLPLLTGRTDSQGQTALGKTDEFRREKQPTVYLVTRERDGVIDSTFIPFERYSRQLDYSKFRTDGTYQDAEAEKALSAFIFSDRGIYRPGEKVQLASIIRQGDLALPTDSKLPLQVRVNGPRGNTFWQQTFQLTGRGFNQFTVDTAANSDTGDYWVSIQLLDKQGRTRQQLGSASFKVEEFLPDTLKISSRFNPALQTGWLSPEQLKAEIQLDNLFGTPAQQRRISARVELFPTSFRFERYKDYQFVDLTDNNNWVEQVRESLPDLQTDDDGKAVFDLPLQQYSGGTYQLVFSAEGFDSAGGRSVRTRSSALLSPLQQLVGFKTDGDLGYLKRQQQRQLDFIAIDNTLQQVTLNDLQLKIIEKRPLSSLVKQYDGTYQYQTVIQEKQISEQAFSITTDGSSFILPTEQPGDFEVQLFNQQQLLTKAAFTVVGKSNLTAQLERNAALQVKLDKADYKPGEWIELSVTAPYHGTGLITIETHKVHAFSWFTADTTSSVQRIRLPEGLEGNAYINVSFVRAADSEQLFISPLSYAVVPFSIDRSSRELEITLQAPQEVRPGKPFSVGYKTEQPADLLIYGVDEGILQVAGYRLPDPLSFYLKKRALLVRSLQMLDLILPEFTALQRHLAGVGGDAAAMQMRMLASNLNPFSRRVDQPGVFWVGIVSSSDEMNYQQVTVPASFSGNIKLMAVAVSDTAMAAQSKDILVRGPFVLTPDVLTTAAPGDEFDVSVSVANGVKGSGEKAPITVQLQTSANLQLLGEPVQQLQINEGSEASARFRVKALTQPGEAELTFSANWQQGDITEQAERSSGISIRPAQHYQSAVLAGYADKGPVTLTTRYPLYPQLAEQRVSASASPMVLVEGLSAYLEHYPHGCTEQVVSQVFPWIGLVQQPQYQQQLPQLHEKFAVLIQKLAERQQNNGGFSFWPGGYSSADFPSIYAVHFLLDAQEQGFAVPGYMLQQGLNYLKTVARQSGANLYQARLRANAIYLLTRSGEVTTNYLVELHERMEKQHKQAWQSDVTAMYMAASYQLLQKPDIAQGLISGYRLGKVSALQSGYLSEQRVASGPFSNPSFQSQLSLDAQYVYLLARHFPERAARLDGKQVLALLQPVFKGDYNTIGAAYSVLGLSAYAQVQQQNYPTDNVRFAELDSDGKRQDLTLDSSQAVPAAEFSAQAAKILIEGAQPLFYSISEAGFAMSAVDKPVRDNLEIVREYLNEEGKVVTTAEQGQQLTVRVRLRTTDNRWHANIAVIDLLPAGFEVIRSSVPRQRERWSADYVDIREDRIVWYAGFGPELTELSYQVKVTAAGDFTLPAAHAESMYDRSVRAGTVTGKITVTAKK